VSRLLTRAAGSSLVRLLITVAILAYLASQIDMGDAARAVISVRPGYLAAVLGLVAIDRAVMILRWILLLRASGVAIEPARAASIFLVSSFIGSFLPSGIGGDAARAYGLSRSDATGSEALASVVVDRLLGIVSLALMGVVGLMAWRPGGQFVWQATALATAVFAASCALFWTDVLLRWLVPAAWLQRGLPNRVRRAGEAIGRYRARGGALTQVLFWSVVVQILRIVQAYLLGLGLDLAVPFSAYLLFMPPGLLMLLLPISVSGFGLPQGVFVWMLRPFGVPDPLSLALSTLIVLTGLAGNVPGMVLWLRRDRAFSREIL
jgi:glycosyltransferase 2 family protein